MQNLFNISMVLVTLNIFFIFLVTKEFSNLPQIRFKMNNLLLGHTIYFSSYWFLQALVFYWVLLIPQLNPQLSKFIAQIILLLPFIIYIILSNKQKINFKKINFLYFISIYVFCLLFTNIPNFAWDDFAYHIPIELLIRDSGSLWRWPDIIYAQWDLIGGDIVNSLFSFGLGSIKYGNLSSLISSMAILSLFMRFKNNITKFMGIIMCLSVSFFVLQISTRYVDIVLAWALLIIFVLIFECDGINLKSRYIQILLVICMGFAFSVKYSSIFVLFFLILFYFYKTKIKTIKTFFIPVLAFLIGTGPVLIRNFIEKNNALYPYYLFDKNQGYNSIFDISNIKEIVYKNSINLLNEPELFVSFYQYLLSPVVTFQKLILSFINNNSIFYDDYVNKYLTYDNRVGGFGLSIYLIIFIGVYLFKVRFLIIFPILFFLFSLLPVIIHARYYFGLFLILLFYLLSKYDQKHRNYTARVIFIIPTIFLAIFSLINVLTLNFRINSGTQRPQLNINCSKVIKLGSDVWYGSALWGNNYCGKVVYGKFVYEEEIQINELKNGLNYPSNPKLGIQDVNQINSILNSGDSILVLCSSPNVQKNLSHQKLLPPCSLLYEKIKTNYKIEISEIFEEQPNGPLLQKMQVN